MADFRALGFEVCLLVFGRVQKETSLHLTWKVMQELQVFGPVWLKVVCGVLVADEDAVGGLLRLERMVARDFCRLPIDREGYVEL